MLQDETKIPAFVLGQDAEFHALNGALQDYEKIFKCNVEVIVAENSKEQKAKQALPFKAAILVI